ncbi:hypothetical protein DENSPDRAFT_692311 [Dentipellis sp. KUC8613]|nr:hypothetical protein DENSPDRAFT_692311 [Dentipellis sp. KUC8613]
MDADLQASQQEPDERKRWGEHTHLNLRTTRHRLRQAEGKIGRLRMAAYWSSCRGKAVSRKELRSCCEPEHKRKKKAMLKRGGTGTKPNSSAPRSCS